MRTLVAALVYSSLALSAEAAEFTTAKTDDGTKSIIKLSGQIVEGDTDKLSALLGRSAVAGETVAGLWLDSPGGSITEGLRLAAFVHGIGINTVVAHDTLCASACFLPFVAGASKYASRTAHIGVHSAIDGATEQEDVRAMAATVLMARAATTYGVPAAITGEMVNTVPKEISWLSEDELLGMGVVMTGGSRNTVRVVPPAEQHVAPSSAGLPSQTTPMREARSAPQRAALLIDATQAPDRVETYVGEVVWRVDSASPGPGQPVEPTVRADIEVPQVGFKLSMVLQRNTEPQFPASHTLDLKFSPSADSSVGSIKQINVPQMRRDDSPSGDPLIGLPVTITENNFLVGLSRGEAAATNLFRIRTRNWFDIPLLMTSGKVAKITFEKGTSGDNTIDRTIESWQGQVEANSPDQDRKARSP